MHWPVVMEKVTKEDGKGWVVFPVDKDGNRLVRTDVTIEQTWQAMEQLVAKGLVKSIGVSNFTEEQVDRILKIAKVKPVMNQVESHVYLNQQQLQKHCESVGANITAYSPLGNIKPQDEKQITPLKDETVIAVAAKHKKTAAQVLIRWCIDTGKIVIPKSVREERLKENANVFDFQLDAADLEQLNKLTESNRHRCINPRFLPGGKLVWLE